MISLIVAMDRNRLIGCDNRLPWHLPADLKHFKAVTLGKPVVMGRKTYESIGKPLPERHNIVVSRNPHFEAPGCAVARSVAEALRIAGDAAEIVVIGGAQLYADFLPRAQRIYLTHVNAAFDGDAWFPALPADEWREVSLTEGTVDERNVHPHSFQVLERVAP